MSNKSLHYINFTGSPSDGPEALQDFLFQFSSRLNISVLIFRHVNPVHNSRQVQLLSRETDLFLEQDDTTVWNDTILGYD
jgi:chemotaxis response regulator CheB